MPRILLLLLLVYFPLNAQTKDQSVNNEIITALTDSTASNDSTDISEKHVSSISKIYLPQSFFIPEEVIIKEIDRQPAFAAYRDNYFITGIPLNKKITNQTADLSFQISFRQRLTRSVLPFNSFLYLTYTQKCFWNIYAESSPFKDSNYNPGLGIGRYIIHNERLIGTAFIQFEHESNGQSGLKSRSWNYLSFAYKYAYNTYLSFQLKLWLPLVDGENNQDLLDYKGLNIISVNAISPNNLWWFSADVNPRKGFGNSNLIIGAGFRISEKANQYLFAHFYNGYGESLLEYDQFKSSFRIGFCIKPDFYSAY